MTRRFTKRPYDSIPSPCQGEGRVRFECRANHSNIFIPPGNMSSLQDLFLFCQLGLPTCRPCRDLFCYLFYQYFIPIDECFKRQITCIFLPSPCQGEGRVRFECRANHSSIFLPPGNMSSLQDLFLFCHLSYQHAVPCRRLSQKQLMVKFYANKYSS